MRIFFLVAVMLLSFLKMLSSLWFYLLIFFVFICLMVRVMNAPLVSMQLLLYIFYAGCPSYNLSV